MASTAGSDRRRRSGRDERSERAVYVISVAADLAGVHPQTLRIYERRGLIRPERTAGGSRRYSDADIARLQRIQELTAEGLSLTGVERFIELEERLAEAQGEVLRLRSRIEELEAEHRRALADVHRQYRRDLVPVSKALVLRRRR
ncbi:MAG TPA: MerR family transcriptional regulator [Acidimicrobiia bacterium]|nr:MerR family transcriptional regulator [Acidimicrobiia bacterium]